MQPREISFREIEEIIGKCQFCHVAMVDISGKPYVIPMNFGYENGIIYFHSGPKGKKIDILNNNPEVCVEFSTDCVLRYQNENVACSYSMRYRSVLAYGKIEFVEDYNEKENILRMIMKNYSPLEFTFSSPSVSNVSCWKMKADRFEGRAFGY